MRLFALALASLLLASCGEVDDRRDDARKARDSRPDTLEWTDGKGDMWAAKFSDADVVDGFVAGEPRPRATNGDIRHVSVALDVENLVIKVQYQDLDLDHGDTAWPLRAWVDTNVGLVSQVELVWDGTAPEPKPWVDVTVEGGGVDDCRASSVVDSEGNTATVRVPRSCLGVPRWVRVYVESQIDQPMKNYQAEPAHMDSAMDAGFPAATKQDGTLIEHALSERVYVDVPPSPSRRGETALTIRDPRGDVVSIGDEADDFSEGTLAPQRKDGDILGTRVQHTTTQLRIRVQLARLVRHSRAATYRLSAELKTNAGTWVLEDDMRGPAARSRSILYVGDTQVPCDLDRSIDYAKRSITLVIPRVCLGDDPAWVQVSVGLVTWQPHGVATFDDAHTKGYDDTTIFSDRAFKP